MGNKVNAWEKVQKSRRTDRPTSLRYIDALTDYFIEFHGDRFYSDDAAIIGGIGLINEVPVTIIGQEKGSKLIEKTKRNFGMASPDGYRKSLRLMKQAEKFGRPVICIVDTAGAFCGIEAEERGQGEAIAKNLFEMSSLSVPIISIIIGEGGSGGALALAVSDEVWMFENAIYSVLSPEGYAAILYKDGSLAPKIADQMKMTADDLKALHVIDRIISEPGDGAHDSFDKIIKPLKKELSETLEILGLVSKEQLIEKRYERYRKF
jgi:acetyl-CoA carboxylase carboxyl transferase alpha subunit